MEKNILSNTKPLVSVLIGSFNRQKLIRRCLDSILNQTYENIEIIVVDDASSDNTTSVLEKYVNDYPNQIQFIRNETNKGIAYNSNLAYSLAKGDYFALIGDDDEWHDQNKIAKQLNVFEKNSKLGIVSTFWNDVKNGQIVKKHEPIIDKDYLGQILRGNGVYCGSTVLISRNAWKSVNGFDESIPRGTDSDLFRSIIAKGYTTEIMEFFSANIYIDDHIRMTPTKSIQAFKKDILSNEICLFKFKEEFKVHKRAKRSRKKGLIKKYLRLLIKEPQFYNIIRFVKGMRL